MHKKQDKPVGQGRFKLSIFPKLFIALVVVVAPLYGIAMLMNQLGEARLEEELSKSLELKVDFYLNTLEVEYEHMTNLLQEYTLDKDVHYLAYLSETMKLVEFTDTIRRIQLKLAQLRNSSIYAKSVNAHFLTLGRSMSSEHSILPTLSDDFAAVEPLMTDNGTGIFYWQNRMFIGVSHPAIKAIMIKPGIIISAELDLEAMEQALTSFNDYDRSGALLIYPGHDLTLSSHQPDETTGVLETLMASKYVAENYRGIERVTLHGEEFVIAYDYSNAHAYYLVAYIPTKEILGPIDTYRNLLWLLSFAALVILIVYSYGLYLWIHRPLQTMIKAFRRVEQNQLATIELPKSNDEFKYLFQRFNMMVNNLNTLIHQVYEQKLLAQSSELKQLQAQINPHFLYNTYFILYRLAKMEDNESVARFSQYLGDYFQYITRNASDEIPLDMEYMHAQTYVEIQNIRFRNRITVVFEELAPQYKSYQVPRLIIQPIVENAYKYGLEKRRTQGRIHVKAYDVESTLFITVEDNGEHLTDEHIAELQRKLQLQDENIEFTGLLNIQRRLQINFGSDYGLTVRRGEMGGLLVTLQLPWYHTNQNE